MKFSGVSLAKQALRALALFLGTGLAQAEPGADVAMVTFLRGGAHQVTVQGPQAMRPFAKLKQGDVLALERDAWLQIVYFAGGRHETWSGGGHLEVRETESLADGLPQPTVKKLPSVIVQQIARTPILDGQGRAGVARMRAIAPPSTIAQMEKTYKRLRMDADRDDLNPELYLLSGLFEMRELERVEQVLGDLQRNRRGNPEAGLMVALYQRAVKNAREAKAK
jgi:hypothetical protein